MNCQRRYMNKAPKEGEKTSEKAREVGGGGGSGFHFIILDRHRKLLGYLQGE